MDIDIALDDMKGQDFAEKINEYLVSIGGLHRNRHEAGLRRRNRWACSLAPTSIHV